MPLTLTPNRDLVWKIGIDGSVYELHPGDLSATVSAELRKQSDGWRVAPLLLAARSGIDADVIAGLLFLARRQAGDIISYSEVIAQVDAVAEVTVDFGFPEPPDGGSPEA